MTNCSSNTSKMGKVLLSVYFSFSIPMTLKMPAWLSLHLPQVCHNQHAKFKGDWRHHWCENETFRLTFPTWPWPQKLHWGHQKNGMTGLKTQEWLLSCHIRIFLLKHNQLFTLQVHSPHPATRDKLHWTVTSRVYSRWTLSQRWAKYCKVKWPLTNRSVYISLLDPLHLMEGGGEGGGRACTGWKFPPNSFLTGKMNELDGENGRGDYRAKLDRRSKKTFISYVGGQNYISIYTVLWWLLVEKLSWVRITRQRGL